MTKINHVDIRFETRINNIPCICCVYEFHPKTGGDRYHPTEGDKIDFCILDRKGYPAPWLMEYVDDTVEDRLLQEFKELYLRENI